MPDGILQYVKLENRLVLLAWLNSLFGYKNNRELLQDCKAVGEGFGADGRSYLYHHLVARGNQVKIPADALARYDENIRQHLDKINRGRTERITLRYFQYLAALYTEIYLDRLFNHHAGSDGRPPLLVDLNSFVRERNTRRLPVEPQDESFTEDDLTKLAFWMATGSGKTLILHLNYHQFLHYNRESLDNILLITPNEGLSEQHLAELAASSIPARRFDVNTGGLWSSGQDVVQVIEITKLVEEKRGGGVSVPVEAFEGRNLIFVDEGHKGSGGEAWRKYRDALGATGFTFEYSATFGQALSAARNDPLTAEYGKAILFDYSYKYFYGDGFGKDFRILNLRDVPPSPTGRGAGGKGQTETLLLGNLLSFYEQVRLYEEQTDALRPYNLEKPLWVFVGSTVNAVYTGNKQPRSDVLTVVRFLHRVLSDRDWAVKTLKAILDGKTGLVSPDGSDVFAGRFPFLRERGSAGVSPARPGNAGVSGVSPAHLYDDILQRLFHASAGGGLHVCEIKSSPGELGLKAANATAYFGLIYIGDTSEFKKLVEANAPEIVLEQDAIAGSLFERINRPDSGLHVLIGARKFMEGWNSWRVASMGLLNIGRQEGSQIIQLFGRGVRLKGKAMSLKRSAALDEEHPDHISLLETLNIFAVRANYMAQFRDYLEREGVEVEPPIELPLFVRVNEQFLKQGLVVPRPPENRDFTKETALLLEPDSRLRVHADMSVKVQALESTRLGLHTTDVRAGQSQAIPAESLNLVDWQQAYLDVLAYKARKGWSNLVISPETLRRIIDQISYTIAADESVLRPQSLADRTLLQQAVTHLLCRYVDRLYQTRREQWDEQTMVYRPLDQNDPNLGFRPPGVNEKRAGYVVRVPRSEQQLVEAVQELLKEQERLYQQENDGLPRIHFDRHLYQPLLVDMPGKAQIAPPGLKESEARFVRDLRDYWEEEKDKSLAGKEIFLLRNLSRGYGIGFFEGRGFYPDFIMWVVDKSGQRIVFIEPHGMLYAKAYTHDEKAHLHERLPALAEEIRKRSGQTDITLDAFIVSATPYDDLHQHYDDGNWDRAGFAEKHILFQERGPDYDYMSILFGQRTGASCVGGGPGAPGAPLSGAPCAGGSAADTGYSAAQDAL
ncbi:DEAD/DEAH box helicase family protein [Roseiflexus sp.]|uniref:DEAD/DEAH box helicase family protein n=1 Tax=Roseiflexus sp. TaxID=2562120 RepID=UPI0021DD23D3|nr:DEAD/DEAH box helicase family protein [Roseiflexus sp.]GIV99333.1 MAG: type III restriction endonuclease subunit R [Roseiflexus sp.]